MDKLKFIRVVMCIVFLSVVIILSPIIIFLLMILAFRAIIIELTQGYRCMRCGRWIHKKKRGLGVVHWCSKDCYLDR